MNGNTDEDDRIQNVWAHNLHEEMLRVMDVVERYPVVSMDTEFPGVVARPVGQFTSSKEYMYQLLRCNVDLLRLIQLGLTFSDDKGNYPEGTCTWQFNFKFDLQTDTYAEDSIKMLQGCGLDFEQHRLHGIDSNDFAELFIMSGIVLNPQVKWVSFHSSYDFGYLVKTLTGDRLPSDESDFFELLKIFFPNVLDIKYLMTFCELHGGLNDLARDLNVKRIGQMHQAGSDSIVTCGVFFSLLKARFENKLDEKEVSGILYGLNTPEAGTLHSPIRSS